MRRVLRGLLVAMVAALVAAPAVSAADGDRPVEVVVTLDAPPLARAVSSSRAFTAEVRRARLDLADPSSTSYLRELASVQRTAERGLVRSIPGARVRWRYGVVLNALAVVLPARDVDRLATVPGVARVWPNVRYRPLLDRTPRLIGAPDLWGPSFSNAGNGIKIGIVDDGVDHTHPFFNPSGYIVPSGFPKGNRAYTNAKVIAARAFPPPRPSWRHAAKPFDPEHSEHATHVAGIAAGNAGTNASGRSLSGIAPRAYIGNYKVLTIPTASNVGLDGNAPEIARGIEAAVRDGMDVINLSLGEPEIEPSRDLVVAAIDGASAAGVVITVAAGNDFDDFGRGTIGSPGTARTALTAATSTKGVDIAAISAARPTPVSLQLKPDVTAPGASILSSVPEGGGRWQAFSGTSMADPHVAGAAALLRQRHRAWTPAQVKSALVQTARPLDNGIAPTRQGSGLVSLPRAANPLLFAEPTAVSFGLVAPNAAVSRSVRLHDAGGGGEWTVRVEVDGSREIGLDLPASVTVPGTLVIRVSQAGASEGETSGTVVLERAGQARRIPFWLRVSQPSLAAPTRTLSRAGTYGGNNAGKGARVTIYRYPEVPTGSGVPFGPRELAGPEQVFRVQIRRRVGNFGVVVLTRARGVSVEARIVEGANEDRLVGYTSLGVNLNPYLDDFLRRRVRAAGAIRPEPGTYEVVFDSPSAAAAGRFTFRYWLDDRSPPRVRLLTPTVRRGRSLVFSLTDGGSGVDPASLRVRVDGVDRAIAFRRGRLLVGLGGLAPGRHRISLQVSDYQETRNMENEPRILPNTRRLSATFRIR